MDFFLEAIKKRFVTGQDARLRVGRHPRLCRSLRERRVPGATPVPGQREWVQAAAEAPAQAAPRVAAARAASGSRTPGP